MGYAKLIEYDTSWICPKTGSYKIICVAGGQGGSITKGANKNGGTTSFGNYITATGSWGESIGDDYIPLKGYTLLDYGVSASSKHSSIGYGGGGLGKYSGGIGKLNMSIVTLNKGDTVNCSIGAGGEPDTDSSSQAGRQGCIFVQYLGDDGWEKSGTEEIKTITVNLYAYGESVKTITINLGESIVLPKISNVKSDDVEHYGWTKTAGSTARNYATTATITPISDMDLYAVFKYQIKDVHSSTRVNANTTGTTVTAEYDGVLSATSYSLTYYDTDGDGSSSIGDGSPGQSPVPITADSTAPSVMINNVYYASTLATSGQPAHTLKVNVKAGDIITAVRKATVSNSNSGSSVLYTSYELYIDYPTWDYSYHYRSDV